MSELPHLAAPDPAWEAIAAQMTFTTAYEKLWQPGPRGGTWFTGGELNLSVNCLDRHLPERADKVAMHWEGEPGDRRSLTYRELHEQVLSLTRALRSLGVGPGDRVGLHLGWLPEIVVAMFACARIGAIHTVLPAPLPAEALAERLAGLGLKVLFTQDGAWRHGTVLPLKSRADEALSATESVEHTIVVRRTGMDVSWYEGDRWYHDLVAAARPGSAPGDDEPLALPAEHPVSTTPQANRRGEPLLIHQGTAAALATSIAVHRQLSSGGVFWCAAEVSWIATQFHGIYGPLACGDTTVMFEGTLDIPTHARAWEIGHRYGVATLLTSPSVARAIRGWAESTPQAPLVKTLRRVVTAGEAVEPELSEWLLHTLGGGRLQLGNAWGQLELGGIARVVGLEDDDSVVALPDLGLEVVDRHGQPVPEGTPGEVVLRRSWVGIAVCISLGSQGGTPPSADARWTRFPGSYATGDRALRDPQTNDLTFLGRTDDVVTVSGQLVSLGEVRQVLAYHPYVAAVDVMARREASAAGPAGALVAAVALKPEFAVGADLSAIAVDLVDNVREMMGGLARPRMVVFIDRIGDDLSRHQRAQAILALTSGDQQSPQVITWEQLLAAAEESD